MALAMSKAAPLRPDVKLSQALKDYEAVLTEDQKRSLHNPSPLASNDVMALTFEINRQNASRRSRRWGSRLTTFLASVKGFTAVVDLIIGNTGNPIAGAVWGAVKMAIQVSTTFFISVRSQIVSLVLHYLQYEYRSSQHFSLLSKTISEQRFSRRRLLSKAILMPCRPCR